MKENAGLNTGRAARRLETRKAQREARVKFHPRGLARSVVHNLIAREGRGGMNKVKPGTAQSPFAANWRKIAGDVIR